MITASLTDINIDKDLSHVRVKPFLKKTAFRTGDVSINRAKLQTIN